MKRFKSILAYVPPLGSSHRALDRAVKIATHNHASLTVVDVARERSMFLDGIFPESVWSSLVDREDRLRTKTSWIDRDAVPLTIKLLHGRPSVEIVREVLRDGHDLVIKDIQVETDDDDGLFFGSVDMRLLRSCPCPVWLVKPKKDVPFQRILAAIDPQAVTEQDHAMNAAIIELASSLAETEAASVSVASAWLGPGEWHVSEFADSSIMQQYLEVAEDTARATLDRVLKSVPREISPDKIFFRHGYPHDVITQTASSTEADLIIMGTLARTGVPGILLGNTAEKVLRSVYCSVLTLKPLGFESPIAIPKPVVH